MNDALNPSPPAIEVVGFLNATIKLQGNDKFTSHHLGGNLFEISFNPRKNYTEGGDEDLDSKGNSSDNVENKKTTNPSREPNIDNKPEGKRTEILDQMDIETKTSLMRENEGADILAQKGFKVEQNPVVSGTSRKPDFKIEGEIFDCYSPFNKNKSVRGIWNEMVDKVVTKKQTERIFLNLKYWEGNIADLQQQLSSYPIEGLKEVMILDKANNIHFLNL